MGTRLTKKILDDLRPKAGADTFIWDIELRGFGVRMKPSGSASFLIQYRNENGRTRRLAIGPVGTLTVQQARDLARDKLHAVRAGQDPSAERKEKRTALTVAELCEAYLKEARAGRIITRFRRAKRQSTVSIDEGRVARHIVPLIGSKVAGQLSRVTVQRMADSIAAGKTASTVKTKQRGVARVRGGTGTAARVVELLGGIWSWAERRGFVSGPNPAHGIELQRGEARDRILSPLELQRLGVVLEAAVPDRPVAVAALRLIALTGLRREEACGLRWKEVDEAGSCLHLGHTKTGRSTRPVGKTALELLLAIPRTSEWVFPNAAGTGSADLKKAIADLFDAAGLRDARSHDLRRTFASCAADAGYSDATIAELLCHSRRGVTARHYIRRPDAALVSAASTVAERLNQAMATKPLIDAN